MSGEGTSSLVLWLGLSLSADGASALWRSILSPHLGITQPCSEITKTIWAEGVLLCEYQNRNRLTEQGASVKYPSQVALLARTEAGDDRKISEDCSLVLCFWGLWRGVDETLKYVRRAKRVVTVALSVSTEGWGLGETWTTWEKQFSSWSVLQSNLGLFKKDLCPGPTCRKSRVTTVLWNSSVGNSDAYAWLKPTAFNLLELSHLMLVK